MGRRAAKKGRSMEQAQGEEEAQELEEREERIEEDEEDCGFFACYLLASLSPRHKGRTYIGFTVNPRRRIRQHNGEIRCGAWRTKRGRPWEMILCIYGFTSNVSALQFEWAWQHPTESLAVRKAASNFKSLSGVANKMKIAYTMLNLPSWENLNLTVNFFSTKHMKHLGVCPSLPKQMKVNVCVMDDLPCYAEGQIIDCNNSDDEIDYDEETNSVDVIREHDDPIKGSSSCGISDYKASDSFRQESETSSWSVQGSVNDAPVDSLPLSPEVKSKTSSHIEDGDSLSWLGRSGSRSVSPRRKLSNDDDDDDDDVPLDCRLRGKRWQPTDALLLSPEGNVIDLSMTPGCIVRKCNKRAKVSSEIIDLTDSPIIIQL